jgi:hypothetical protein
MTGSERHSNIMPAGRISVQAVASSYLKNTYAAAFTTSIQGKGILNVQQIFDASTHAERLENVNPCAEYVVRHTKDAVSER